MDTTSEAMRVGVVDALVILAYIGGLLYIGFHHSKKQKNLKDFFLAGKSMKWLPVGMSIMAALNSGTDYLMTPSAMIQYGALIFATVLNLVVVYPYVFLVILPFYRRLDLFSVYEYLEHRFNNFVRTLVASIFVVWRIMLMSMALYVPCLTLTTIFNVEQYLVGFVVVLGLVVTVYTMMGGIKGVIWIDVAQFCVMFGGLLITIILVLVKVPGGLGEIIGDFGNVGTEFRGVETDILQHGLFSAVKEYFLLPMSVTGIMIFALIGRMALFTSDQLVVQRFQTTRTIRDARVSFFISVVSDFVWLTVLGFIGVALFSYFTADGRMPQEFIDNPDVIFPRFMVEVFPAGVTGLVVAAILAASLSSFDGALNSVSSVTMVDFVNRLYLKVPPDGEALDEATQRRQVLISRVITAAIGLVAILVASYVDRLGTLIQIAMKILGGFGGPLLAVFVLGMWSRWVGCRSITLGVVAGVLSAVYCIIWSSPDLIRSISEGLPWFRSMFPDIDRTRPLSPLWPGPFGMVVTFAVAHASAILDRVTDAQRAWTYREVLRRDLKE